MPEYPTTPERGHLYQILTVHKNLLQDPIGALSPVRLAELNVKLALATGLVA